MVEDHLLLGPFNSKKNQIVFYRKKKKLHQNAAGKGVEYGSVMYKL
jgi:hypothetical protein